MQLSEKRKTNTKDAVFDKQLRLNAEHVLPKPNNCPPSLYIMKKLLECKQTYEVQQHVCVNDCCRFAWLDKRQYLAHKDECCPHCQEPRFDTRTVGDSTSPQVKARKVCYDFGLANVIRDRMFTDPAFCKHRGTGRETYYYNTDEAARTHQRAGVSLHDRSVSGVELSADFAQTFHSKVWSTGFIMAR